MSNKINYSLVQNSEGNIAVQSKVESFGLDHITSKDIVSFYKSFSQFAAYDTGLLPVDGAGMLSIRSAGEYTQFAYQHKPGLYRVNWAATEGNPSAAVYYVAQPYRIIICDIYQGNLLGARTFYSPYPITVPSQPLYHVNLPNINCKGYRSNGVGWICLYQNEDWSELPFNEKIVRFIERCSGVETYNDGNMSETDGTRFYQENNKPDYLWDPIKWQEKSQRDGFEWTLDPNLWIPVLVAGMDDQQKHDPSGVPLTFADALVGDYMAYYYDKSYTKPINAIIRPDKEMNDQQILSYFVASYNFSSRHHLNDTFNSSIKTREQTGSVYFSGSSLTSSVEDHNDVSEDNMACTDCQNHFPISSLVEVSGNFLCSDCLSENYVYLESLDEYFYYEDEDIYCDNGNYYHLTREKVDFCRQCGHFYAYEDVDTQMFSFTDDTGCCKACIDSYAVDFDLETNQCVSCSATVLTSPEHLGHTYPFKASYVDIETKNYEIKTQYFCSDCVDNYMICPCGIVKPSNLKGIDFNPCGKVDLELSENTVSVNSCCSSCLGPAYLDEQTNQYNADFVPMNFDQFKDFQNSLLDPSFPVVLSLYQGIQYADPLF